MVDWSGQAAAAAVGQTSLTNGSSGHRVEGIVSISSFFWWLTLLGAIATGATYLFDVRDLAQSIAVGTAALLGVAFLTSFWEP